MTALGMIPNLEYNVRIAVSRDSTSSSSMFFSFARTDSVTNSPPCLAVFSSLAIHSFSAIRKWTLELVDSAYALVESAKAARCLRMSDTITQSSYCTRDVWSSRVDTLQDCKTLCWDSLNEMLCISPSGWSPRISMSPWSLRTCSSSRCGEAGWSTP